MKYSEVDSEFGFFLLEKRVVLKDVVFMQKSKNALLNRDSLLTFIDHDSPVKTLVNLIAYKYKDEESIGRIKFYNEFLACTYAYSCDAYLKQEYHSSLISKYFSNKSHYFEQLYAASPIFVEAFDLTIANKKDVVDFIYLLFFRRFPYPAEIDDVVQRVDGLESLVKLFEEARLWALDSYVEHYFQPQLITSDIEKKFSILSEFYSLM